MACNIILCNAWSVDAKEKSNETVYQNDTYTCSKKIASVSLGGGHSAIITKSGELYMWGYNENGQIKDVTTNCKLSPEKIMDNVAFASLGDDHSAVIKTNGDLYTWGDNKYGQLGDGIKNYSENPQKLVFPMIINDNIKFFVDRLYANILGRTGDEDGINTWAMLLADGTQNGATASYGFVNSAEFLNSGLTNDRKVEIFYNTFLNREADAAGKKFWVDALNAGVDIEKIFEGFVMSEEFAGICNPEKNKTFCKKSVDLYFYT